MPLVKNLILWNTLHPNMKTGIIQFVGRDPSSWPLATTNITNASVENFREACRAHYGHSSGTKLFNHLIDIGGVPFIAGISQDILTQEERNARYHHLLLTVTSAYAYVMENLQQWEYGYRLVELMECVLSSMSPKPIGGSQHYVSLFLGSPIDDTEEDVELPFIDHEEEAMQPAVQPAQ